jgi:mitochondrial distribution and morphology protein 10
LIATTIYVHLCVILFPVSTGLRFTTMPDATPPSFQPPSSSSTPITKSPPSQPPTTITALYNPMLGHLSGAYSARVSPDLSLSTRFDFNVYSIESEWTMGAEWWLHRPPPLNEDSDETTLPAALRPSSSPEAVNPEQLPGAIYGVVKARASTSNVSYSQIICISSYSLGFRTFL